jgi:1-aminocyclopropane-1-carboxylate deaminase
MVINNPKPIIEQYTLASGLTLDILRLDKIHPQISGNKWYKLKYYLEAATDYNCIATMGGAYSNHLHATAYACKLLAKQSIGIVRGDKVHNATLQDCLDWGMELHFIARSEFDEHVQNETFPILPKPCYTIAMGGDGALGVKGASEILQNISIENYDYISCGVGTGTTLKGLFKNLQKQQKIIGIAAVKDERLKEELFSEMQEQLLYLDEYTFGGFGKSNKQLVDYILNIKAAHGLVLDQVYTAKAIWALEQEYISNNYLSEKKILFVHTGGVQGNRSNAALAQLY